MTRRPSKPAKPATILEAAGTGDRRTLLVAMRDHLAAAMDEAPPTVVAQISAKLAEVAQAIEDIDQARPQESVLDDLRRRRDERERAEDAARAAAGAAGGATVRARR